MTIPTVSLIMTVYNRDRFLALAIESILVQTEPDFELILWDDGSTDGSLELMQRYAAMDDRIRLFGGENSGHAVALKAAHEKARGRYVGSVDSDDLLSSNALEVMVPVLEQDPSIGMVYSSYRRIDEQNRIYGMVKRDPYSPQRLLVDFMTFHFRLMRRDCYEAVGGIDSSFSCAMDYDLCLKLSEITTIHHLDQPLYFYRTHANSMSSQRRVEQIQFSKKAVLDAIARRGLEAEYELDVEIHSRFHLRRKHNVMTLSC
jgi:glycosyltransferase involved in cell wall biosynthesis